jgi:arginine:ornithine antiporter/lysine permease
MFAFELPYQAALRGTFPAIFKKVNKQGTPIVALLVTNILVQIFIFTFLVSESAYVFAFSLATTTILIPYALTAFYQVKYSLQEKKGTSRRTWNIIVGLVASLYAIWLVYAAGLDYLLLTAIIYAPGILVFAWTRLRKKEKVFTLIEASMALVFCVLCGWAIYKLTTGQIVI